MLGRTWQDRQNDSDGGDLRGQADQHLEEQPEVGRHLSQFGEDGPLDAGGGAGDGGGHQLTKPLPSGGRGDIHHLAKPGRARAGAGFRPRRHRGSTPGPRSGCRESRAPGGAPPGRRRPEHRWTETRMPSTGRSRTARTASGTESRCSSVKQPWPGRFDPQALGGKQHGGDGGRALTQWRSDESGTGRLRSGVTGDTLGVPTQQQRNAGRDAAGAGATVCAGRASNPEISLCGRGPRCILKSPSIGAAPAPVADDLPPPWSPRVTQPPAGPGLAARLQAALGPQYRAGSRDRPRRHGGRLPGPGHHARPGRRRQGGPPRTRHPLHHRPAISRRSAHDRAAPAPEHRDGLHRRRSGRPPLLRDGPGARRLAARTAEPRRPAADRGSAPDHDGHRRGAGRRRERGPGASRREAREHPASRAGTGRALLADFGIARALAVEPAGTQERAGDRAGHGGGHAELHEPGAGGRARTWTRAATSTRSAPWRTR